MKTCIYTMTPDEDFVIGPSQVDPRIILCSACSGHGYKFGTAVGRRVADALESGDDRTLVEWLAARD